MSNKFGNHKKPTNQKVSDLMLRLPVLQQLNNSQAILLKLTPIWLDCLNKANSLGKISTESIAGAKLSTISNKTLVIRCSSAVIASQFKQSQQFIIDSIRKNEFIEIEQIKLTIEPAKAKKHRDKNIASQQTKERTERYSAANNEQQKPSSDSLEAILKCQKLVDDESLATSLAKLADTLKKL